MRRGLVITLLAGALLLPAQAAAATPQATIAVSNVHWVSRGTIGLDVAWTCTAPTAAGAEWAPALGVVVQSPGPRGPWGYTDFSLSRSLCDGTVHQRSLQLSAEYHRFHGTRFVVMGMLDASWWVEKTGTYVEQWAETPALFVRLHRR